MNRVDRVRFALVTMCRVVTNFLDLIAIGVLGIITTIIASGANHLTKTQLALLPSNLQDYSAEIDVPTLIQIALIFFVVKGLLSFFFMKLSGLWASKYELRKTSESYQAVLESPAILESASAESMLGDALLDSANMAFSQSWISFSTLISEVALIFAVSFFLCLENPPLFLALAVYLAIFALLFGSWVAGSYEKQALAYKSATLSNKTLIRDSLENYRQIFTLKKEVSFRAKFESAKSQESLALARMANTAGTPRYITEFLLLGAVALLVFWNANFSQDAISLTTITIFTAGAFRLIGALLSLQSSVGYLKRSVIEGANAFSLSESSTEFLNSSRDQLSSAPSKKFVLELRGVYYSYPGNQKSVLRDINLGIRQGEFVGITGESGAGKSTLVDILLGLREPTAGEHLSIFKNEIGVASDGNRVGYVPQRVSLINGTLAQNVALDWAVTQGDFVEILYSLDRAGLSDLLSICPDGLNSLLGPSFIELSGGQLQRLGIARALYRKASLLVLDEVTSALDSKARADVLETIYELSDYTTVIMISHRASDLAKADSLYKLSEGQLVNGA